MFQLLLALSLTPLSSPSPGLPQGDRATEFRTIDGTLNNPNHPNWGAANTELRRGIGVDYSDGVSTPAGENRASARFISNQVVSQSGLIPNSAGVSDMVWQWGQFLDHDIDITEGQERPEELHIPVPLGDPHFDPFSTGIEVIEFFRSTFNPLTASPWREQVNQITAFIDASNVYGSDPVRAAALRYPSGRMKTSPGKLLPFNITGLPNAPDSGTEFFLAGDVRANEQLGLTAMHTLFVREHNRIARRMFLSGVVNAADIFERTRRIIGAEMQAITYREFLPVLLGPNALPPYQGYKPEVDPSIKNEFSTACYRFGHSMISASLMRLGADLNPIAAGNIPLSQSFFNPQEVIDHGIEPLLRGLTVQQPQEVDVHLVDDIRNLLFGPPGSGGLDLASLNIQRGRDHGLPSYNDAREALGLTRRASFLEVSSDQATVAALTSAYISVDDIDLWVGGLAEDHVSGALVGELIHTVLVDQFTRLRDGDSHWYELTLTPGELQYVNSTNLSRIIQANTEIGSEISDNAFLVPSGS